MPLYEFACQECGDEFEKLVRSTTTGIEVECPSCRSHAVKKKLSTFAARSGKGTVGSGSAAYCTPGGT